MKSSFKGYNDTTSVQGDTNSLFQLETRKTSYIDHILYIRTLTNNEMNPFENPFETIIELYVLIFLILGLVNGCVLPRF